MSNRAAEYRGLIDDVIAGGLLEEDEILELRDMLARVQRKVAAAMPADQPTHEAAE
jgi:hypothetical protein